MGDVDHAPVAPPRRPAQQLEGGPLVEPVALHQHALGALDRAAARECPLQALDLLAQRLALGMAGSVAVTGLFTPAWPMAATGLVVGVLSATAMSWHGILLSETARLAPAGRVAAVTGGVLSFGQIGAFLGPSLFSLLLHVTGGYGAGWAVCAIPGLWVAISLLRRGAGRTRRSPVSEVGGG